MVFAGCWDEEKSGEAGSEGKGGRVGKWEEERGKIDKRGVGEECKTLHFPHFSLISSKCK